MVNPPLARAPRQGPPPPTPMLRCNTPTGPSRRPAAEWCLAGGRVPGGRRPVVPATGKRPLKYNTKFPLKGNCLTYTKSMILKGNNPM